MADAKKKTVKKASHPKYHEMIIAAISSLKDKKGSSRVAILKYISTEYSVSENRNLVNSQLKTALKKGVSDGHLTQVKGSGASGSFKVAKTAPKAKKTAKKSEKVVKPKAVKSPKKAKAKSTSKKPKVKKSPKKAATKSTKPKKVAAKKPAKKATKPKVKKSTKKAAKK